MPKNQTKRIMASLLLIDIISILCFVYIFNLTRVLISESVNKEDQIKIELKKEDVGILMKSDLVQGKVFQEKLMQFIVPQGGTVDFIKILEQLASSTGIKSDIKTVSSESYENGNPIGTELIRVNMDVMGEWKNVRFFLTSLENYPLKIDIKKVDLNSFSDNTVNGKKINQWSGNFEFTVAKIKDTK